MNIKQMQIIAAASIVVGGGIGIVVAKRINKSNGSKLTTAEVGKKNLSSFFGMFSKNK